MWPSFPAAIPTTHARFPTDGVPVVTDPSPLGNRAIPAACALLSEGDPSPRKCSGIVIRPRTRCCPQGTNRADDGAQTVSTPVHITAIPALPAAPSNLIATIALSWKDNSINEESFVLQRSKDGVSWVGVNTFAANTTTNNNRFGILSGKTYFYRIRARNSVGFSAFAYSSAVTAR